MSLLAIVQASPRRAAGQRGDRGVAASHESHAASEGPKEERDGGIRSALRWFYGQRAFPRRHTPKGALIRARAQAARLPVVRPHRRAGAAPTITSSTDWTELGPHPLSGKDDRYSGASPFGGRVTVVSPVGDGTRTYIGTAEGGVWRTTGP